MWGVQKTNNKAQENRNGIVKRQLIVTYVAALCSFLCAVGCQSVPLASMEHDASAKEFTISPGKTKLIVFRKPGIVGQSGIWQIAINGKIAGYTAPGTFGSWELEPGDYTISSYGSLGLGQMAANLKVSLTHDKSHFIELRFKNEFIGGQMFMKEADQHTGQDAVRKCKLIESIYK